MFLWIEGNLVDKFVPNTWTNGNLALGFRFCCTAEQMGLQSLVFYRFTVCLRWPVSLKSVGVRKLKACETLVIKC